MVESLETRVLYAAFNSGGAVNIPDLATVSSPITMTNVAGVVTKVAAFSFYAARFKMQVMSSRRATARR
jgi:hypothetical protein